MEQEINPPQESIFEDVIEYVPATTGQRFVNYLIDYLLMEFGLSWLTRTLVGGIIASVAPDYAISTAYRQTFWDLVILGYAIAIFNYIFYYTICEKAFRGYTLGKLISGTRAIRKDGAELTFKDAFLRSLCRLVPFEPFSGFGTPWHDSWTNTTVVKAR